MTFIFLNRIPGLLSPLMLAASATNRIYGLDIFRAVAILFVMQVHSLEFLQPHLNTHAYWLLLLDGVDLFFVLSGFLIGSILIRTIEEKGFSRQQLFSFWQRRWWRTLPNYFLILVVLMAGYLYAFGRLPDKAPQFFVFLQNFSDPHPRFFPESWSLAVEEWFYLLVPIGLFFLLKAARNKKYTILFWIVFVLATGTAIRLYKAYTFPFTPEHNWDSEIRKLVITRLDSIVYGFLGAWLKYYRPKGWLKNGTVFFLIGLFILYGSRYVYSFDRDYGKYFYISVQSIGALCILPKMDSIRSGKGVIARAFTFISIISYSMYLLNYTIVLRIIIPGIMEITGMNYKINALHSAVGYVLFWVITILLSWCLYKWYEKPLMRLREKSTRGINLQ